MNKTIYVAIGSDTDPDRPGFIPGHHAVEGKSWRGMLEGVPRAKEALCKLLDDSGHAPVFTWCLRADYQMQALNGSHSYIMETHRDFLLALEQTGDELAWHPHFWNLDKSSGKWYQEIFDVDWQVQMLKDSFAAYSSHFPGRPKSVRMGWDYHNNRTLATLAELGIIVDFSGIPGWKIDPPSGGKGGYNCYDWRITPNNPYFPSKVDYRRPSREGEECLKIMEAPNFVSTSFFWGTFGGSVMSVKMKNPKPFLRSLARPTYWIAATGKSILFTPLLSKIEKVLAGQDKVFFVTYFHPDEFLLASDALYSLSNMQSNLSQLLSLGKKLQAQVKFIRASEIAVLASDAKS